MLFIKFCICVKASKPEEDNENNIEVISKLLGNLRSSSKNNCQTDCLPRSFQKNT